MDEVLALVVAADVVTPIARQRAVETLTYRRTVLFGRTCAHGQDEGLYNNSHCVVDDATWRRTHVERTLRK
jgi:hypothetical protein